MRPSILAWPLMLGGLLLASGTAVGRMPLDLTFGRGGLGEKSWPWGWNVWDLVQNGYEVSIDHEVHGRAGSALRVDGTRAGNAATAVYRVTGTFANGRRLSLRGGVRVLEDQPGKAFATFTLIARAIVEGEFVAVAVDSTPERRHGEALLGDGQLVEIDVPKNVDMVDVELRFRPGRVVWVADLELLVDGQPVREPRPGGDHAGRLVGAVRAHAIPLATADPMAPSDDLGPVVTMLGEARYVLLGESTHGTHEFFGLKHRLIRALVERNESVVIALEDHQAAVAPMQEVVTGGSDRTVPDAMRGLFRVWHRDEMRAVVEWARETTRSGHGAIVFAGVDMQDPLSGMKRVVRLLEPEHPDLAASVDSAYDLVRVAWRDRRFESAVVAAGLDSLARDVIRRLEALDDGASSATDLAEARRIAAVVPQAVELARTRDQTVRDRSMAANLRALGRDYPHSRIVFWGHNGHSRLSPGGMGGYLEADLPGEVVAFGLLTYEGLFRGIWPRDGKWSEDDFPITTAPPASVEALLHRTGLTNFALDLRSNWARSALGQVMEMRSLGAVPEDYGFGPGSPDATFHALLFVNRSSPATALGSE